MTASGDLAVRAGRVAIRYKRDAGAKSYQAGASRVALDADAPVETLESPVEAASSGKRQGDRVKTGRGSGYGKAGTRSEGQAKAARVSAEDTIAALQGRSHLAFTDGGCKGNPGPAGSGVYVELKDGRKGQAWAALGRATNNIAELTAIRIALELLEQGGVQPSEPVVLFSDSSYAKGVLTQGWKAKANVELIAQLRLALARWSNLEFRWVAGHVGVQGNELADHLAERGVHGESGHAWSDA